MLNYQSLVSAKPAFRRDDRSLSHALRIVSCDVNCYHIESDVQGPNSPACIVDDDRSFSFQFEQPSGPFASNDHSPSLPSWATVSSMEESGRKIRALDREFWFDLM